MYCMQHFSLVLLLQQLQKQKKKTSNLNQYDASVIKVSDYYCLCQLKTLRFYWLNLSALLSILLCALQYLTALASVTLISDCINPTDSSCYYVLWALIARYDPWDKTSQWTLPNSTFLWLSLHIAPPLWLHVIPLLTWLKIPPYWRSLHERMPPLSLLSTYPIVAPPQLSETSSGAVCWEVIYSPSQPPSL